MAGRAEAQSEMREAIEARIDDVLDAHGGNMRSAIETLLLYSDGLSDSISYGYIRGRFEAAASSRRSEEAM